MRQPWLEAGEPASHMFIRELIFKHGLAFMLDVRKSEEGGLLKIYDMPNDLQPCMLLLESSFVLRKLWACVSAVERQEQRALSLWNEKSPRLRSYQSFQHIQESQTNKFRLMWWLKAEPQLCANPDKAESQSGDPGCNMHAGGCRGTSALKFTRLPLVLGFNISSFCSLSTRSDEFTLPCVWEAFGPKPKISNLTFPLLDNTDLCASLKSTLCHFKSDWMRWHFLFRAWSALIIHQHTGP